jgi:branched-chain amino acid transport system ATP-binding protein
MDEADRIVNAAPALRTENLSRSFAELAAVDGVSLALPVGARHALIGPNGAGKTTLINLLTGVLEPSAGEVFLAGERITRLGAHERVKRGIARTFQVTSLFPGLTVMESMLLAIHERNGAGGRWHRDHRTRHGDIDEARSLLARLRLERDADTVTSRLPYGRQRVVEIALALATRPRILLLDEPAAGIPAGESTEVLGIVGALPGDVTVLFIEHDMNLVLRFAERITVLVDGRILMEGTPEEVARDERVKAVYLGAEAA